MHLPDRCPKRTLWYCTRLSLWHQLNQRISTKRARWRFSPFNITSLTCELVVIVSTLATKMVFPLRRTMPVHQPEMNSLCMCAISRCSAHISRCNRWPIPEGLTSAVWQAHGSRCQTLLRAAAQKPAPGHFACLASSTCHDCRLQSHN